MRNKSSVIELLLAVSVLMAFLLAGCYTTVDNRTKVSAPVGWSNEDLAERMKVQGPPRQSVIQGAEPVPRLPATAMPVEKSWSQPLGRDRLPTPNPFSRAQRFGSSPASQIGDVAHHDNSHPQSLQSRVSYSQAEELWIISRPTRVAQINDDQYPGTGAMVTKRAEKEIPLPLKHTDVKAKVNGYIATVEVTQRFFNPYDSKIEAIYVFPLPEDSAVHEFVMIIGERQIRGIIREREEAERIYKEARSQGNTTSMMTEERSNIFTQSVANIEPGKQIDVNIKYFNTLAYMDGWFEFVFPMVVGPRFNPAGSKDGVGAIGRGTSISSGQRTEVSYLRPGERSGHDIALEVEIDAGVAIEEFECTTHRIVTERPTADKLVATLAASDRVPNKDFVLRYRVTGGEIKAGILTHKDERGGFFTMMLYPPAQMASMPRAPMEMVFVLDCSGSMNGRPIAQAKEAIRTGLKLLKPFDSFQLINFSISANQLGSRPLAATPENIRLALRHLDNLNAEGGTMMIEGIKAALDFPQDPRRLRFVCFLTDGYIGNESDILQAIDNKLGLARIFSFGVGTSVNRYLLDSMARTGRGAVAYLLTETDSAPVMSDFFERISHPALTNLEIDWNGLDVKDVYPKRLPDLFAGRPVLLTGRFRGEPPAFVNIRARQGETDRELAAPIFREDASPALASIWARSKIADLALRSIRSDVLTFTREIKKTALDFGLLSQFTAFIAVDSSRRTEGWTGTTVPVAVPTPEGVKYNTTVTE
jgi:Ca-activated chloride channel family protein